jgi:hypothetical protein
VRIQQAQLIQQCLEESSKLPAMSTSTMVLMKHGLIHIPLSAMLSWKKQSGQRKKLDMNCTHKLI